MADNEKSYEGRILEAEPNYNFNELNGLTINKEGEAWVGPNESRNNKNSYELLQTINHLRTKMLSLKEDNERILKD